MENYRKHSAQYPYLVVRIASAVYNIISQPADLPEKELIIRAVKFSLKNKVRACMVFSQVRCVYVEPDGTIKTSESIPAGGVEINEKKIIFDTNK